MASAPVQPGSDEAAEVRREFERLVNMTANQLQRWLATDESRAVGQKDGGESVGHASGRRIVAILGKRNNELNADDLGHMKKVVGYIKRHLAQRPDKPARATRCEPYDAQVSRMRDFGRRRHEDQASRPTLRRRTRARLTEVVNQNAVGGRTRKRQRRSKQEVIACRFTSLAPVA